MKGFKKLSSIALLLLAFVYPPSVAQAKDLSLSNNNTFNEQSAAPEANLLEEQTGELLIAQRRSGRYQVIRRRQQPFGRNRIIRQRQPFGRYQIIRQRELRRNRIIRQRQPFGRYRIMRQRELRRDRIIRQRQLRRDQQYRRQFNNY
jgi:hypothetical protein